MNEWISVNDRMPSNETQVIAWVGERALTLTYCDDGYWCERYGARNFSQHVTHWMPLTEPLSDN